MNLPYEPLPILMPLRISLRSIKFARLRVANISIHEPEVAQPLPTVAWLVLMALMTKVPPSVTARTWDEETTQGRAF